MRQLKRLLVLVAGLVAIWFTLRQIFPVVEGHVPIYIAVFVTYLIGAYAAIPTATRLMRLIARPDHIPMHTTTPDGYVCDPVNVGIVGSYEQLVTAMTKAGWYVADKKNIPNMWRMGIRLLLNKPYPSAPFSRLYLFGRPQDIGFQMPIEGKRGHRHHIRFWMCQYTDVSPRFLSHVLFWRRKHGELRSDQTLWVGAATKDIGAGLIRYNAQLTHAIDPDTNAEREFIVQSLRKARELQSVTTIKAGEPTMKRNRVIGVKMIADGEIKVCTLKKGAK